MDLMDVPRFGAPHDPHRGAKRFKASGTSLRITKQQSLIESIYGYMTRGRLPSIAAASCPLLLSTKQVASRLQKVHGLLVVVHVEAGHLVAV